MDISHDRKFVSWVLTPFSTIVQSYNGGLFIYPYVSCLSYTNTPHKSISKQLAAFPYRFLAFGGGLMTIVVVTFFKRRKECLSSFGSKFNRLDYQTAAYLTELWGLGS